LASVGISLIPSTANLPFGGESILGVGVSLVTAVATAQISGTLFQFNTTTVQTQYIPLLAGFA
jgi:hypothetical protein